MGFLNRVSGFIFGMECLGCGTASERLDPWLCQRCVEQLGRVALGARFPGPDAYSLFPMNPLTRRLVHALKYKSIPGMASYMVKRSSAVKGEIGEALGCLPKPFYFVPVPLHRARRRERGYNQAEKIAAALSTVFRGRVCHWLRRKTFVVSQTKLSKEEREWNVAGAFEANLPKKLPGRGTVIVVDDVYTTGATTTACLGAFGKDFPLTLKVCTLLFDEPASAVADFAADIRMEWDVNWPPQDYQGDLLR